MPANLLFAGMARSYGCPAKSFSDTAELLSFLTDQASALASRSNAFCRLSIEVANDNRM